MVARREFWREEAQAAEVLAKWKISGLPVDPFFIAKSEEIICERIRSTSPGVSGCLASKESKFGIFYGDYFSNDGFCRFTVAVIALERFLVFGAQASGRTTPGKNVAVVRPGATSGWRSVSILPAVRSSIGST